MVALPMSELNPTHDIYPPFRYCPLCGGGLEKKQVKVNEPDRLVCRRCAFIYYLDPKVAAATITLWDNKIVLVKRGISPGYGKWVIPGGFVDRGETLEEAAVRETLEETNLQVEITSLLNVYSYPGSTVIVVAFLTKTLGGLPKACDEGLEVEFFFFEKIPWSELAFPSTRDALLDYGKHLGSPVHFSPFNQ
jgi:ADP-ribose pyrophosphatase YjhB (NUDIX family)